MSRSSPAVVAVEPVELSRCDAASSFLQSGFWGSFKARFGWNARAFVVEWTEGAPTPLLTIRRRLGPLGSFAYAPWGPELPDGFPEDDGVRSEATARIAGLLKDQLPHDTSFLRFDPPWRSVGEDAAPPLLRGPLLRASADVQPPDSVEVDLRGGADTVLTGMKPKWRYNVRLAEKRGVVVERRDEAGLEDFYSLFLETARRDGIATHGFDYYRSLFDHAKTYCGEIPDLRLYVASHEGEPLAANIVLLRGDTAVYLYGASSDRKRALMPTYALQWAAMREAAEAGCETYDLFGIPPSAGQDHPMEGLYRFKTGFGGAIVHRPGSWDYAYDPFRRGAFALAERLRKDVRSSRKRRLRAKPREAVDQEGRRD